MRFPTSFMERIRVHSQLETRSSLRNPSPSDTTRRMPASSWLVKQEPGTYCWDDLVRERRTAWTGIRNYQARNYLREMRRGDAVLFYHSGGEKRAVGIARVARAAYPDPTADEGDWSAVDLEAVRALKRPVTLGEFKADMVLKKMALMRQTRLSVTPVTREEFQRVMVVAEEAR